MYKSKAYRKIIDNNRKMYGTDRDLVLLAGSNIYNDMWTRDAFIGALGLLNYYDNAIDQDKYIIEQIVLKYIILLKDYQREDGLIPLKIGKGRLGQIITILFGSKLLCRDVPVYVDDKNSQEPTDSNSQYIIICYMYCTKINDRTEFFKESMIKALDYIKTITKNHLIYGTHFNTWYDSYVIDGAESFSNVLYGKALKCMISLEFTDLLYEDFQQAFIINFVNNKNLIKIHKDISCIEIASNSFAVLFNILPELYTKDIARHLLSMFYHKDILHTTNPKVPSYYLYTPFYFVGMSGYHNDRYWPWVTFIAIAAVKEEHSCLLVNRTLYHLDSNFDNMTSENVDVKGNTFKHWFQSSEKDFLCSLGAYLLIN